VSIQPSEHRAATHRPTHRRHKIYSTGSNTIPTPTKQLTTKAPLKPAYPDNNPTSSLPTPFVVPELELEDPDPDFVALPEVLLAPAPEVPLAPLPLIDPVVTLLLLPPVPAAPAPVVVAVLFPLPVPFP